MIAIRQTGAAIGGVLIFFAFVFAMSRLLQMKELPGYIKASAGGIANLFRGVYGTWGDLLALSFSASV
jgi:hypothetical protein